MEMFHMYTCNFLVGLPKKPKNTQKGTPPPPPPPGGGGGGGSFLALFLYGGLL